MSCPSLYQRPTTPRQARYVHYLKATDPPADAVARALEEGALDHGQIQVALRSGRCTQPVLRDFLDAIAPPLWVDPACARRGCEAFQRTGILGGIVLSLYSLPLGYLSPAGVKPLALSGRLVERAPRRLSETNRFLTAVTTPGGMEPGAPGAMITAQVRLMHAVVRRRLQPQWQADAWGAPISQAHMAATNLLFSLHALDGLRKLGVRFHPSEVEGYLHLWRHVGYTIGVADELLCSTEDEARRLWSLTRALEAEPDADCRALALALVGEGVPAVLSALLPFDLRDPHSVKLIFRLSTALIGRKNAAALGFAPQSGPLLVTPLLRTLVGGVETMRSRSMWGHTLMVSLGRSMNHRLAEAALDGQPAHFVA